MNGQILWVERCPRAGNREPTKYGGCRVSVAVVLQEGGDLEGGCPRPADLDACHRGLVTHALKLQLQLRQRAECNHERHVACCVPST